MSCVDLSMRVDTRQYDTTLRQCHIGLSNVTSHCLVSLRVIKCRFACLMSSHKTTSDNAEVTYSGDICCYCRVKSRHDITTFSLWNVFHLITLSFDASHCLVSCSIIAMSYRIVAMSLHLSCVVLSTRQATFYMALIGFRRNPLYTWTITSILWCLINALSGQRQCHVFLHN